MLGTQNALLLKTIRLVAAGGLGLAAILGCEAPPESTTPIFSPTATDGTAWESPLMITQKPPDAATAMESPLAGGAMDSPLVAPELTHTPTLASEQPPETSSGSVTPSATPVTAELLNTASGGAGYALRFFGTGRDEIDRVTVRIDDPPIPADVGAEGFTIEWWMKASLEDNSSGECAMGNDNWITGNIMFDRDIWGSGDYGDFGVSLANGRIAFGVNNGTWGEGVCSETLVADGQWHHVAVVRSLDNATISIFVDGRLEAEAVAPDGDLSYRDGRATDYPDDPFLVIGAEKHDAGPEYPSYNGMIDEVRISSDARYAADFTRPDGVFQADEDTVALWHFDEGAGETAHDAAPGGASVGIVRVGGPQEGPKWVISDAPVDANPPD